MTKQDGGSARPPMGEQQQPAVDCPETRYRNVTVAEAHAAAKARVTVDKRRGRTTPAWIVELAETDPWDTLRR